MFLDGNGLIRPPSDGHLPPVLLEGLLGGGLEVLTNDLKLSALVELDQIARHHPRVGDVSNHAALGDAQRTRLLDAVASLIDTEFGGSVTENYVAVAALARRRA